MDNAAESDMFLKLQINVKLERYALSPTHADTHMQVTTLQDISFVVEKSETQSVLLGNH